ncbi:MAG TPA: type II toxin-antitoxin system RelE/ParE family toxin [Rhodopila sp.]|nr:type II toxin-antitoxin system RelE/ParE family toxin [Rhodopila sp.]
MVKTVRYGFSAARDLKKHGNMSARARKAIAEYAADVAAHANNVTPLVGTPAKRMRIGDFRLIFEETDTEITVTRFAPRGGVYE